MGVDFYSCSSCEEVFCDAGEYFHCTVCGEMLCSNCGLEAIAKYGSGNPPKDSDWYGTRNPNGCPNCDPAIVKDEDILEYLLEHSDLTKEQIKIKILEERKLPA